MSRLPFDPAKMAAAQAAAAAKRAEANVAAAAAQQKAEQPAEAAPISVGQLCARIDRTLREHLAPGVRVIGEIGQFRERTHWYFDLKDETANISCVMFAGAAAKLAAVWEPRVGERVIATGRVEFFAKQGRTQFYVTKLEPIGEGALDAALRRLVEELRGLGWLDAERKRPLPVFPRRVAVITSRTGAALQDVLDTFRRRCCAVEVALIDVRVQGDGAAPEIARALRWVSDVHGRERIDAVLLTRGGGSKQDLWAFNERAVAEAIVHCAVPVVAAIGHETDVSVAELVADERAATPTQAAMRLSPDKAALNEQLDSLTQRLDTDLRRRVRHETSRVEGAVRALAGAPRARLAELGASVDRVSAALERHRPAAVYAARVSRVREAGRNLEIAIRRRMAVDIAKTERDLCQAAAAAVARRIEQVEQSARALDLVGPSSVLRRGYSATFTDGGKAVRSIDDVQPGDRLTTRVADGSFKSVVGDSPRPLEKPLPARVPRRPRKEDGHPGLFNC